MTPAVGENGNLKYLFIKTSETNINESFGMFTVDRHYNKLIAPKNEIDVEYDIRIFSVSKVDSLQKVVGLDLILHLSWEDERIKWFAYPQPNEE